MQAFTKAWAYGGPLPRPPEDFPPRLRKRANDAKRRAYVRGILSCYAAWYPWPCVVTHYAWGVSGRSDSVWFHILEVFAPDILGWDGYKSNSESMQQYLTRTKYRAGIEAEAVANVIESEAGPIDDDQEAFCSLGKTRKEWAKVFHISVATFDRRRKDGTIKWKPFGKLIQVHVLSLPKGEAK